MVIIKNIIFKTYDIKPCFTEAPNASLFKCQIFRHKNAQFLSSVGEKIISLRQIDSIITIKKNKTIPIDFNYYFFFTN